MDTNLTHIRDDVDAISPRPERPDILAFVADAESEAVLREGLAEFLPRGLPIRRANCAAVVAHLRKSPTPRTLIIDVSGEEQPISALLALAEVVEPDVRVLVIGDRVDINFYRQVTRGLSVLEYLYKPLVRMMVARHFGPWLGDGGSMPETVQGGRVISITGVGGGTGATTVAANMAWHFATDVRRHTLLLDANLHTGNAALSLNVRADTGLRTALETPERVDELFIDRSAQPVTDRLFVMSSEERLAETPKVAPGAAQHLLTILRRRYNFVIVDAPFRPEPFFRDLLDLSHQRVFVMSPTLPSVRDTLRLVQIRNGPTQGRRPVIVLNRLGIPGTLSLEQVEEGLGARPDVVIPFLPRLLGSALTLGKPAVSQRGAFREGIIGVGRESAFVSYAEGAEVRSKSSGRGWFKRRAGR